MKRFSELHAGDKFIIAGAIHVRMYLMSQLVRNIDSELITQRYNAVILRTGNNVKIHLDQEVEPTLIYSKGNYNDRI